MSSGTVLELSSLPAIHPDMSLLYACGPSTIVRLSRDPIAIPSGKMERSVAVNWVPRAGDPAQELTREIGWSGVPAEFAAACEKWVATKNEQAITEEAAIGVMALLVHHLGNAVMRGVLPIGSGGDYLLLIPGLPPMQIESSGIHTDPNGYFLTARLKEKAEQVLKKCDQGFASVVAFSHSSTCDVRCELHHVTDATRTLNQSRRRKKSRKKPRKKHK